MRELTKEELEFEIAMISKNIYVLKALGVDIREPEKRLALYRAQLLAIIQAEHNAILKIN